METFLKFLKEYGVYLAAGFEILLTIILMIIKKRPKTIDDFLEAVHAALLKIPAFASSLEEPGNGESKKKNVLELVRLRVSKILDRSLTDTEKAYIDEKAAVQLEAVLAAPQKKAARKES